MGNVVSLFRTKEEVIKEALENAGANKLVLTFVDDDGHLQCMASEDITIIEAVGMLETAKTGFLLESYATLEND